MTGQILAPYTRRREVSMSSTPERNGSTEAEATSTQVETGEALEGNSARDDEIRHRAYDIHLERGGQPGVGKPLENATKDVRE
jgi:hypothetical protein